MLLGLVVEGDDLELLVVLVVATSSAATAPPRRCRFALIFCRPAVFSPSVTSGTITPSLPT